MCVMDAAWHPSQLFGENIPRLSKQLRYYTLTLLRLAVLCYSANIRRYKLQYFVSFPPKYQNLRHGTFPSCQLPGFGYWTTFISV
ncbi:unnamed protein product [Trichobilharzia szidati]|nr:unnamed protein product [Trichobilharzia szidati]